MPPGRAPRRCSCRDPALELVEESAGVRGPPRDREPVDAPAAQHVKQPLRTAWGAEDERREEVDRALPDRGGVVPASSRNPGSPNESIVALNHSRSSGSRPSMSRARRAHFVVRLLEIAQRPGTSLSSSLIRHRAPRSASGPIRSLAPGRTAGTIRGNAWLPSLECVVSISGFHEWRDRGPLTRDLADAHLSTAAPSSQAATVFQLDRYGSVCDRLGCSADPGAFFPRTGSSEVARLLPFHWGAILD
jgi:hypothetical protein